MDNILNRLNRLRTALEDMQGVFTFGFGILRPSPAARVTQPIWKKAMEEGDKPIHPIEYRNRDLKRSCWLDPCPNRTYCVRWWGDKEGIKKFKEWGKMLYGYFLKYPELEPKSLIPFASPIFSSPMFLDATYKLPSDYFQTINALMMFATKNTDIAGCREHTLLECKYPAVQVIPCKIRDLYSEQSVNIVYHEIGVDAVTLGLGFIDKLIESEKKKRPQDTTEVTVDYGDELYLLKYNKCSFCVPNEYTAVFALFAENIQAAGEPIGWTKIQEKVGSKVITANEAGPTVRSALHKFNQAIKENLGNTPNGKNWILSKTGKGAYLNTSHITWRTTKKFKTLFGGGKQIVVTPDDFSTITNEPDKGSKVPARSRSYKKPEK